MDSIESITLKNVEVQQNGIIRNEKGYLIGRLVDSVDYEGEHIKGLNKVENKTEKYGCSSYVEGGKVIDCICGKCF